MQGNTLMKYPFEALHLLFGTFVLINVENFLQICSLLCIAAAEVTLGKFACKQLDVKPVLFLLS